MDTKALQLRNDDVRRIEELKSQIAKVKQMLAGEHMAAGLQVSINVGKCSEDKLPELNCELMFMSDELLELVLSSLQQSLDYRLRGLMKSHVEIDLYLNNLHGESWRKYQDKRKEASAEG